MYYIECFEDSDFIFLFKLVDNHPVCIYYTLGFTTLYNYILEKEINFYDIEIKGFTFNDLFKHFVDRSSIDENYRGDRV